MTVEELQARLDQAKEKVNKRLSTIEKLCKKLNVDYNNLLIAYRTSAENNPNEYFPNRLAAAVVEQFIQEKPTRDERGNWLDDNYEFNSRLTQLEENLPKLFDLEKSVKGWELKLQKQTNRENVEQIPILVEFLDNWERNCKEYYLEQRDAYIDAYNEFHDIQYNWLQEHYYNEIESRAVRLELVDEWNDFIRSNYGKGQRYHYGKHAFDVEDWVKGFDALTTQLCSVRFEKEQNNEYYDYDTFFGYGCTEGHYELRSFDEEKLDKILHEEKIRKYAKLVEQVTAITGPITDVSGLSIDPRGDLNGIAIGENGRASVNTIGAGGYNIQCYHFRTLVKSIK